MAKAASSYESLAIGVDIGGTGTKFGIVDRIGNVLFSSEISTRGHSQVESFIDELHTHLSMLIDKAGGTGRMRGIGVGAPNGNYYSGTVEYAPNLPWRGIIPLAKLVQNKFQLPTILTNDANATTRQLVTRYAKRVLIENTLADAVRFFHIDALSSSVGFKVDFDMALLVLASGLYRLMGRRMRGYDDTQARQIFRDLIDMPANISISEREVTVRFHRRAHLPIVLASGLFEKPIPVPWWDGRPLRLVE